MLFAACISCTSITYAQWKDPSPHQVRFVQVKPDVRLEVLDWGGKGKPLLFLIGMGDSAHMFDEFAPRFTDSFRVYGLTRRGHGASSQPTIGYDTATLVSDILAVLDSLKLERVIFAGHSIAGYELTKIASIYPNRTAKLVYLDAAYDTTGRSELEKYAPAFPGMTKADSASISGVRNYYKRVGGILIPEGELIKQWAFDTDGRFKQQVTPDSIYSAIWKAKEYPIYGNVKVPALSFYAVSESVMQLLPFYTSVDSLSREKAALFHKASEENQRAQIERFRHEVQNGRVVELHGANHYVYLSHPEQVEKEMRAFLFDK
jgi:pimeloyl-ACP methyl ester carboxylesterase